MMTSRARLLVSLAVAALTSAGCSGADGTPSPISPSPLASPSVSSGATVSGVVNLENATLSPGMIVTVAGTDVAAPVDSSGHFTLAGVPPGDIQLRFTNAGVDATIPIPAVAEQEQIQIAVTVSGGSATMTSQQRTDSEHRVGSHGLVSGLSGTCPDITFTVNGTTVVANASTIFEDGSCSTIQNGTRVEIKGTRQSNGSVLATKVDIDTPSPDPQVEVKGSVSALGGTCPAITFTVNGTSIVANSATRFEDGPCSAVQNGTRVEVKGTRQSNGSVLANKIDIDTPTPDPQVEVKGSVSALAGTCPSLTFTVNGTSVATNGSTRFEDGTCGTVQNGTSVEVKGTRQTDGTVLATKVDIDPPAPPPQIEVKGLVSALAGTCPNLTFTVSGTSIVTNNSTRFEDGPCTVAQNGTSVEVRGTRQSDGSVLASKVDIDEPEVELKGAASALAGTCPTITFSVNGTSVATNGATRFEDGPCSVVQNGTSVEVRGTRQPDGSVLATKVDIDEPHPDVELKGVASGLGGACPNLTFTVNGTSVATNNLTRFEDGPCSTVADGKRVEVKGTRQPNGSVLATKVDIDEPDPEVELKGAVSGLGGGCPNLTFTVAGTSVATSNLTRFEDGPCSTVANGKRVEVKGTRQPNGSVLATKVDIDEPDPEVELKGAVSGLGGGCPNLTFTVAGTSVATNNLTRFEDGPCSTVANGKRAEVKGTRQSDGSVLATKVDIDEPDLDIDVKGTVSGLGGACPSLTFTVRGTSVVTNTATRFTDGPCSAIQNGTRLEVDGTRQANGSVLAHKVDIDR